jgi:hypothetical protein
MRIPNDKTARRDLTLIGECPDCGIPGLHKMPRRVLVCKTDESVVYNARERYLRAKSRYDRESSRVYDYRDYTSSSRAWLNEAREEYHQARRGAEYYTYLLLRECHACDYQWFELIRSFASDREAVTLRERYPEGLVIFEGE